MKILLVEDNTLLAKSIIKGFKQHKILVEHFVRGDDAERFLLNHHSELDLVILDLMLPGKSGEEICQTARKNNIKIPILMLTAKDTVEDIVNGLKIGADDYLTKPFDFEELLARVEALSRRNPTVLKEEKINITPSVCIDLQKRVVYKNTQEVKLSPKEFAVLEVLLKYRGKALSRNEIFNEINDFADTP